MLKKPRKKLDARDWKTHEDAFAIIWDKISLKLTDNPTLTAKIILNDLIKSMPQSYNIGQLRTLQRRVANWRKSNLEKERDQVASAIPSNHFGSDYLSVAISAGKR